MLARAFKPARVLIELRWLQILFDFWPTRIEQALSVFLLPQKTFAQEQPMIADGHLAAGHHIARQSTQVSTIPDHLTSLAGAHGGNNRKASRGYITDRWRQRTAQGAATQT